MATRKARITNYKAQGLPMNIEMDVLPSLIRNPMLAKRAKNALRLFGTRRQAAGRRENQTIDEVFRFHA